MSPKEIAVQWFNEVWNNRNTAIIPELISPDARGHLEGGHEIVGPDQFIAFQSALLAAIPDVKVTVLNALSDGDDSCVLWQASGTHTGQGLGLAPSGKPVDFRGVTWFHVENGKIVEGWDCWNLGGLMNFLASPAS